MSRPQPDAAKLIGESIPDSAWTYAPELSNESVRVYWAWADNEKTTRVLKKELIGDEELQEWNRHCRDTSSTFSKRSIGAAGTPVANIPMSMIFNPETGIAENIRKGNRDHLRWWLNRDESIPFRSFDYRKL